MDMQKYAKCFGGPHGFQKRIDMIYMKHKVEVKPLLLYIKEDSSNVYPTGQNERPMLSWHGNPIDIKYQYNGFSLLILSYLQY